MCFIIFLDLIKSFSVDDIRGVSPLNSGLYRKSINIRKNTFTCFDKSKTINLSKLNDRYCDCKDGSDEPGTNACGNGMFYCRNSGSAPKFIPKWMVDDGVCDCCDGSDEKENKFVVCEDKCGSTQRQSLECRKRIENMITEGEKVRKKYSQRGVLEWNVRRKQKTLLDLITKNAIKAVGLVEEVYRKSKNGMNVGKIVTVLNQTLTTLRTEFESIDKVEKEVRKGSRKIKEEQRKYGRFNIQHRAELKFNVETAPCYLPDFRSVIDRLKRVYEICLPFCQEPYWDEPISKLNKANSLLSRIQNETQDLEDITHLDFGPDKEFLPLYQQWFYYAQDDWYIEFYPFGNATKIAKKGAQCVLGFYNHSRPLQWYFNKGSPCESKRDSSQMGVRLHCLDKDAILAFKETSACHFVMDFGTPSACDLEYKKQLNSMDDTELYEWAKDMGLCERESVSISGDFPKELHIAQP